MSSNFQELESGTKLNVVIAFCDLSLFYTFSQNLDDVQVFWFLSDYYVLVGRIIESGGGMVVKFVADSGLFIFPGNQPGDQRKNPIDKAVRCLIQLKIEGDQWLQSRKAQCRNIIKAHYGPVICGKVGTERDKRFDVFGKTVNEAAQLKSCAMTLSSELLQMLSEETRNLLKSLA